jgi:hypothetical protein
LRPILLLFVVAERVEARLLLVAEDLIKVGERRAHDAYRLQHRGKPRVHGVDASDRGARQLVGASGAEHIDSLGGGSLELVKGGALGIIGSDRLRNRIDRPIREPCRLGAANVDRSAAPASLRPADSSITGAASVGGVGGATPIRISTEDIFIEVVVGVRPERIVGVGVERKINEIHFGKGPEQWSNKADHDWKKANTLSIPIGEAGSEAALECRLRQGTYSRVAAGGPAGEGRIAQQMTRSGRSRDRGSGANRRRDGASLRVGYIGSRGCPEVASGRSALRLSGVRTIAIYEYTP